MSTADITGLSNEKITELIRNIRNELIKDFLVDEHLAHYYQQNFHKELSNIKREFIKRDLRELMNAALNVNHYAGLITHIKETGTVFRPERNSDDFHAEVKVIISKYA